MISVLPENIEPLTVFLRCLPQYVGGFAGAFCLGISAAEIRAALIISRIKPSRWLEMTDKLTLMSRAYTNAVNKKAAA